MPNLTAAVLATLLPLSQLPTGNTPTSHDEVTPYTTNALNQYTTVGTTNYTYDPQGNTTSDGGSQLTYDADSRLTQVIAGPTTVSYAYDPLGRQLSRTQAGVPVYRLNDGPRLEDVDDMDPMQSHHQRVHRGLACAR